jgi:hypothetical protein
MGGLGDLILALGGPGRAAACTGGAASTRSGATGSAAISSRRAASCTGRAAASSRRAAAFTGRAALPAKRPFSARTWMVEHPLACRAMALERIDLLYVMQLTYLCLPIFNDYRLIILTYLTIAAAGLDQDPF